MDVLSIPRKNTDHVRGASKVSRYIIDAMHVETEDRWLDSCVLAESSHRCSRDVDGTSLDSPEQSQSSNVDRHKSLGRERLLGNDRRENAEWKRGG